MKKKIIRVKGSKIELTEAKRALYRRLENLGFTIVITITK